MIGIFTNFDAVQSLVGGELSQPLDGVIRYHSGQTPPSDSAIATELTRLRAEWDSQEYARNRKIEYDALNQFEMQFDDKEDGTTTWEDAIAAIKTKYPKG
tara:strand:- start:50 stop:349 length:300 start_codon:yes stop_codon:yes gene_type:complete